MQLKKALRVLGILRYLRIFTSTPIYTIYINGYWIDMRKPLTKYRWCVNAFKGGNLHAIRMLCGYILNASTKGQYNRASRLMKMSTLITPAYIYDSAVYVAAAHGHVNILKLLLRGRHINVDELERALAIAVSNRHIAVVKELLKNEKISVEIALTDALSYGDVEIADLLIDRL